MQRGKETALPLLPANWSFHSGRALYKFRLMINRADIPFADAALRGASLRGLLILIRL